MTTTISHTINKVFMRPHYIAATHYLKLFKRFSKALYVVWGVSIISWLIVGLFTTEVSEFRDHFIDVVLYPIISIGLVIIIGGVFHIIQGRGIDAVQYRMLADGYDPSRQMILDEIDFMFRNRRSMAFKYKHYIGNHPGLIVATAILIGALVVSIYEQSWAMTFFCSLVIVVIFVGSWVDYQSKILSSEEKQKST